MKFLVKYVASEPTPITRHQLEMDFELQVLEFWRDTQKEITSESINAAWETFVTEVCSEYKMNRNLKRNMKRWIQEGYMRNNEQHSNT